MFILEVVAVHVSGLLHSGIDICHNVYVGSSDATILELCEGRNIDTRNIAAKVSKLDISVVRSVRLDALVNLALC